MMEKLTSQDLNRVKRIANSWFDEYGIDIKFTRHFLDRVNDERNGKEITAEELIQLFKKLYVQHGKEIGNQTEDELQAVATDLATNINIPMVIYDDEIFSKTVMRKKNFGTSNKKYNLK